MLGAAEAERKSVKQELVSHTKTKGELNRNGKKALVKRDGSPLSKTDPSIRLTQGG